jgi:hypothetical protein
LVLKCATLQNLTLDELEHRTRTPNKFLVQNSLKLSPLIY